MADLLGYHLGLVDDETRARVEARFSKEELAVSRRAVDRLGPALDVDQVPGSPADLVDKVMSRVEGVHATLRLPMPSQARMTGSEDGGSRRPLMTVRELVGLAAAIMLFVGIFVPGYRTARLASQQANSADHPRATGNGYGSYAEMFGNQPPLAGALPDNAAWLPPSGPGVPSLSNSRDNYLLINRRFVPAQVFICPGREGNQPLDLRGSGAEALGGFPAARNNRSATQLVDGPRSHDRAGAALPVAGDMHPLADFKRARIRAGEQLPNPRSHGQPRGQNVLWDNLTLRFVKNPNVGVDNDDIYQLIGIQDYTGRERPTLRSDAFLIP